MSSTCHAGKKWNFSYKCLNDAFTAVPENLLLSSSVTNLLQVRLLQGQSQTVVIHHRGRCHVQRSGAAHGFRGWRQRETKRTGREDNDSSQSPNRNKPGFICMFVLKIQSISSESFLQNFDMEGQCKQIIINPTSN